MKIQRTNRLVVGDEIDILDTSNDKVLQGFVRQLDAGRVQAYVTRFKNMMWFDEQGQTRLGRFTLQGRTAR